MAALPTSNILTLEPLSFARVQAILIDRAKELHGDALKQIHKEVAQLAAEKSQGYATRMGGLQAKSAGAIYGAGGVTWARVRIRGGKKWAFAPVAFWGAKRRSGWYANNAKFGDTPTRQHPKWVGNAHEDPWRVGVEGEGPYAINNAIADHMDEILEIYRQKLDELFD